MFDVYDFDLDVDDNKKFLKNVMKVKETPCLKILPVGKKAKKNSDYVYDKSYGY